MSNPIATEKHLLDSLEMPVVAAKPGGGICYANPAAAYRWHFAPEKARRLTAAQIFGANSPICLHLEKAVREESSFTLEQLQMGGGEAGAPQLFRVRIDPVSAPGQRAHLAVAVFWDLTQRERLESRVSEIKRMDAIALMVKGLAHELQNPLSGVKGATQLLARRLADRADLGEYAAVVLREIERLERLVKTLLLQGGGQPLEKTRFNLHELLDTVIWFQSNAAIGVEITRDYDPSLPDLVADRDKLHQVFLNLIQNAAEAGGPAEAVTVRTKMLVPWLEREALPPMDGNFLQVEVEDRGPGVKPEHVEHLFTPFFTTRKHGSGLGLSIAYRIVQSHQGRLRYRNAPGGGAIFSVTLPLHET